MTGFSSLRVRLVGTVFLAITPASLLMYFFHVPWTGFWLGLLALAAAWFGGERFIIRQVRMLSLAAERLAAGDLRSRTGLSNESGELGQLAGSFDFMAESLQKRSQEREFGEKQLLHRSLQQTVVGALGQFALSTHDLLSLLNQAVMLITQTLEVEFCDVLQLESDSTSLLLVGGVGWKAGAVNVERVPVTPNTQAAFALAAGEPVVYENLSTDSRFSPSPVLVEHGIVSGITVAISSGTRAFGLLGAHTTRQRKFTEDEVHFLSAIATLLSMAVERLRAEAELQKLAAFAQLNPNPAMELTANGNLSYFNDAALKLALAIGYDSPHALLPPETTEIVEACLKSRQSRTNINIRQGSRSLSWSFHPMSSGQVVHAYVEDITNRLSLEAQLLQAQKMESVGQLAAGVAHDFNNMLTIIQGHSGRLLSRTGLPQEALESIQAVYFAAERAANLTRQLLLFSRKNVLQTSAVDLRGIVSHLSKMLERLIGEPIKLELHAHPRVPMVQADTGMLEQVLMNLAVNARDAMPKGGKLTISTEPVDITELYAATHPEARPGLFVRLQVTDTGSGMDESTMHRIFEPFFTTKEAGKGTGLGLATVYGIIKQHGGWLEVASQIGQGTTFSVFLPGGEYTERPNNTVVSAEPIVQGGKETILVVEDEPVLRDMASVILAECGYTVLEASTGSEALHIWDRHQGNIQLVVTDMVMPEGMSGLELAQRLRASRPEIKIIFSSGYSMDDMDTDFVLRGHALFLQKPYTHLSLPKAVRDCLDGNTAPS